MKASALLVVLALVGCSSAPQPRALGIGGMQPLCLVLCFQTNTFTDAESGATQQASSSSANTVSVNK